MSQRASGYARRPFDSYETPAWVTQAVIEHLPRISGQVWEPAAGSGKMVDVLKLHFPNVVGTDAQQGESFFDFECAGAAEMIFSNPPFDQAQKFIEHALKLMEPCKGVVVMLLRVDFDSAKTRAHLFDDCPAWYKKVVLLKRIMWFKGDSSPSYNHAFYIWDHRNSGSATIAYAPRE